MDEKEKNTEQKPVAPAVLKDQKTIVRRRDKALMAALGVFCIVIAAIAALGIIYMSLPARHSGPADCEQCA